MVEPGLTSTRWLHILFCKHALLEVGVVRLLEGIQTDGVLQRRVQIVALSYFPALFSPGFITCLLEVTTRNTSSLHLPLPLFSHANMGFNAGGMHLARDFKENTTYQCPLSLQDMQFPGE